MVPREESEMIPESLSPGSRGGDQFRQLDTTVSRRMLNKRATEKQREKHSPFPRVGQGVGMSKSITKEGIFELGSDAGRGVL